MMMLLLLIMRLIFGILLRRVLILLLVESLVPVGVQRRRWVENWPDVRRLPEQSINLSINQSFIFQSVETQPKYNLNVHEQNN